MTYGIRLLMDDGKVYDSATVPASFLDLISITANATGQKQYPDLVGFTLLVSVSLTGAVYAHGIPNVQVSYPSNIPTVSWSPLRGGNKQPLNILVFAR